MKYKNLPKDYISVSQLNTYLSCPEKYNLRYIKKETPSDVTDITSLLLGSSVHRYIELSNNGEVEHTLKPITKGFSYTGSIFRRKLFDFMLENRISVKDNFREDLINYKLNKSIISNDDIDLFDFDISNYLMLEDKEKLFTGYNEELKTGIKLRPSLENIFFNIVNLYDNEKHNFLNNLSLSKSEESFNYEINLQGKKLNLYIIVDSLFIDNNNNNFVVVDWKTSKRKWNIDDCQKLQDYLYTYLFYKKFEIIPEFRYVVFSYSEKTGAVDYQVFSLKYDEKILDEAKNMIHSIVSNINKKAFFKNPSWACDYCDYYTRCNGYKKNIKIEQLR